MNTAYLIETIINQGVELAVTEQGKLRVISDNDFTSTPVFKELKKINMKFKQRY